MPIDRQKSMPYVQGCELWYPTDVEAGGQTHAMANPVGVIAERRRSEFPHQEVHNHVRIHARMSSALL